MLLDVANLYAGYGKMPVLFGVNLSVAEGEIVALLGANGAGKTTTLRAISGLVVPRQGIISFDGEAIHGRPAERIARRGLVHVPEGRGVFRSLTVRENLIMQSRKGEEAQAISQACEVFPALGRRIGYVAGTLSGGEQQMLAMAIAYIRSPRLIMVDEASLGLAPLIVDQIFGFMESVAQEGKALLIVDQFASRALSLAGTAYVLSRGSITYSGSAKELDHAELLSQYMGT